MEDLISIIVPAYKVEKYLPKCIESLINQTYKNIEIILIDDGSPDKTGKICDEYAEKDERIKVIHRENGGVSAARNDGLSTATGDYYAFVDSDDFVSPEYCEKMLSELKRNNAEVALCKQKYFYEGEIPEISYEECCSHVYSVEDILYKTVVYGAFYDCMGGKMYARRLFDNIRFPVGRVYEDASVIYKLCESSNGKIVLVENEYYYYLRQRDGSISSAYSIQKQKDDYTMIRERYLYLKDRYPNIRDGIIAGYIRTIVNIFQMSYTSNNVELINSEIFKTLELEIVDLVKTVDKNVLSEALNNYRLACLYLFIQNRDVYEKVINDLYKSRYNK